MPINRSGAEPDRAGDPDSGRTVSVIQIERLQKARSLPHHKRIIARTIAWGLLLAASAFSLAGRMLLGKKNPSPRPARVVLTGGFESRNWVAAHVAPIAASEECEHVWVVSDRPFGPIANVSFICPHAWLSALFGRVGSRSILFTYTAFRRKADLVGGFHLLCNGMLALVVGSLCRARTIYFCVGGWAELVGGGAYSGHKLFGQTGFDNPGLERKMLDVVRKFDVTITMGTRAKEFLQSHSVTNVTVMPGGIDFGSPPGEARKPDEERFDIILVARLDPIKRIDLFLKVVAEVSRRVPGLRAAIVGDGPLREELGQLSRELGIEQHVTFAGFQPDIPSWLNRSRLFLLTSDSEGLPLSTMEAMTAGLPVVASDVGDLGDLVKHGFNGYLVSPRDVVEFSDRVVGLLTDEPLYRAMEARAIESVRPFTFPTAKNRWSALLNSIGFMEPA